MNAAQMEKALKAKPKKHPILMYPNKILTQVAEPFEKTMEEDELLLKTAMLMGKILEGRGIGLAAPQIGVSKRLIIGKTNHWRFCIVNPEVVKSSRNTCKMEEACLSVPNMKLVVSRPKQITVRGLSLDWKPVKIKARGLLAACLQHEIDHLNGITLANQPV